MEASRLICILHYLVRTALQGNKQTEGGKGRYQEKNKMINSLIAPLYFASCFRKTVRFGRDAGRASCEVNFFLHWGEKKVAEILSTFELEALGHFFCICYNKVYNLGISRGRKK